MRLLLLAVGLVVALLAAVLLVRARSGSREEPGGAGAAPIPRTGRPFAFRVEILLEQLSERRPDLERNALTVVLRDAKGKEAETPEIRLELDGVPLTCRVAGGNSYDRHPSYRLREDSDFRFEADRAYELVAKRPDAAAQPLARLRTPRPTGFESLLVPATHPRGEELEIAWAGLAPPAELLVTRTLAIVDEHGNHGFREGGPHGDDALRWRIGPGGLPLPEGRTTIPASYLGAAPNGVVSSIRLEVTVEGESRFLCPVRESSTVRAVRRIALPVEVVGPPSR